MPCTIISNNLFSFQLNYEEKKPFITIFCQVSVTDQIKTEQTSQSSAFYTG